jgi:hypothetical protein
MNLSDDDTRILRQWNAFTIQGVAVATRPQRQPRDRSPSHNRKPFTVSSGRFRFARVTEFVTAAGEPQTLAQIAKGLGVSNGNASTMAGRAVRAGQIRLADQEKGIYATTAGA